MTKLYDIDMRFLAVGHAGPDELEACLDDILDHLSDLDNVIDPDLTATLTTGAVVFSMGIEAVDQGRALNIALAAVRTAAHACDVNTPGWEEHFQELEHSVRPATAGELIDA